MVLNEKHKFNKIQTNSSKIYIKGNGVLQLGISGDIPEHNYKHRLKF